MCENARQERKPSPVSRIGALSRKKLQREARGEEERRKEREKRIGFAPRIRPIAFTFLMPAAAKKIQLPRALGPYDSNSFDDIYSK